MGDQQTNRKPDKQRSGANKFHSVLLCLCLRAQDREQLDRRRSVAGEIN